MINYSLIPRLNYKYTFKDAWISFLSLFKKEIDHSPLCKMFENENIYFVNHGRTGIRIALNSIGLKTGSRVGVQAFNCHTVFSAIQKAGFKHEFMDVTDNFQIDIKDLDKKKNNIDALIVTHLFGIPADMDEIRSIVPDIPIIEDCAHSFLSEYNGRYTGTIGDIGVFSIGKAKFPSIGDGGYMVINDKKYRNEIENSVNLLKKPSILMELRAILVGIILNFLHLPLIYRLITYRAKTLYKKHDLDPKFPAKEGKILKVSKFLFLHSLSKVKEHKEKQQMNAMNILSSRMKCLFVPPILLNHQQINPNYNYFMLPFIQINNEYNLIEVYRRKGLELGNHFKHSIRWAEQFGYEKGLCSNAETIAESIITFPCYPDELKVNLSRNEHPY